ncbi:bromodomain-containing protein 8 [Hyalella azteca]|uniref:Bromodomain-containing protein 8 n=1 Tax=Hyalella azteca TaxID=294128 RepID=A0A8B7PL80_HYAAZ|nr:bromodomain-containing protein 8 [Hyalella azteca]
MKQSQLDTWSTREQLALVSAVQSSGDQNWVAVSRAIRLLSNEGPRPLDWYSQKNCALQYASLLETVTPAKRKRDKDKTNGLSSSDVPCTETPGETLAKLLAKQHLSELAAVIEQERQLYHQLRHELQQLEAGHLDHQLDLLWDQMVQEEQDDQAQQQRYQEWAKQREEAIAAVQLALRPPKGAVGKRGVGRPPQEDAAPTQASTNGAQVDDLSRGGDPGRAGDVTTPSSPLLSSLLTRGAPRTPPLQDLARPSSAVAVAGASIVQKLFSDADGETKPAPPRPPADEAGDEVPRKAAKDDDGDEDDDKKPAVNGLPPVKEELDEGTCAKTEPRDTSALVIKEDPLIIINKPEAECLQASYGGAAMSSSKEGYQDTVASPTLPKQEVHVWDDVKLQLGEVQRKYSRLGASKYHHIFSGDSTMKLEKESEEEEDVEEDVEEEEEDDGFAGFGPSSLSVGGCMIGSVLATAAEKRRSEDEDVYNIDNDDTIGLKASEKLKLKENALHKLGAEGEAADEVLRSAPETAAALGSPGASQASFIAAADDEGGAGVVRKDVLKTKQMKRVRDDRNIDFDDCDSVDSLATTSSLCGGDSDGGVRGTKRKLQTSDSMFGAFQLGSPRTFSDTSPESPTSTCHGDDLESEKALRLWRKSIMILYNEIAAHKFASVFLRPITEDKVPGYLSVVLRPMDLQTIKRNIEGGVIRTTEEFQRDVMLMCINAVTYNTRGHNVHDMATRLMSDALAKIEEFQSAAAVVLPASPIKSLRRETRESLAKRSDDPSTATVRSYKKKKLS